MSTLSMLSDDLHRGEDDASSEQPSELADVIAEETSRHRRRRLVWIAVAVLAAAAITIVAIQLRPKPLTPEQEYRGEAVVEDALVRTVTATGRIEARSEVEVGAELSGRIDEVLVDYNTRVEAGDVLARFDTANFRAQEQQARASVRAAKASVKQAEVELAEAKRLLQRSEILHDRGVESDEALDSARARAALAEVARESAQAQVALQRANLSLATTTLERAEVRAPIDGQILAVNIEAGQTVAAAFQTPVLFVIAADLGEMRVLAQVDEADIGEVSLGQPATFTVDAYPGEQFAARITEIRSAAAVVQNVVTYEAVLEVDNPGLRLKPGMTATVRIETDHADESLLVPNAALRFTPPGETASGGSEVWVLEPDGVRRVPVREGISDGTRTVVSGPGLEPGSRVLVDLTAEGHQRLQDEDG